jgi:hypothetical protein
MENYIEAVRAAKQNQYLMCYSYSVSWIKDQIKFTSEDLIAAYEKNGANIPEEKRVWGAVIRELQKNNFIKHAGFSTYKKPCGHSKPINVWIAK